MASELAEAGLKVALLDKGPYVTHRDMNQREGDMLPLLYEDAASRTTVDGGFTVLHAHCVGGTTVVNNAICFDPPERVLDRWRRDFGVDGITKESLAPCVAKVRFVLNVQRIQDHEINMNAQIMQRGVKKLGLTGDVFEHNRTGCLQSGFCMVGCSYDRKQNMHITYVPRALSFGALLYPNARIDALYLRGREIVSAQGTIGNTGSGDSFRLNVRARVFVVAGGAISSPCLLLRSNIANRSGAVGKHLHCHPTAPVMADFSENIHFYRGITQVYYVDMLEEKSGNGGFLLESVAGGPALSAVLVPQWGRKLHELMARYNSYAAAFVQVEDESEGTVRPDSAGVPRIDYKLGEGDATKVRQGYQTLARIYLAAGARAVHVPHIEAAPVRDESGVQGLRKLDMSPGKVTLISAHQMGTCRMGEDPKHSVVNSRGKVHEYENLYVADASVFPSAIGVNPQITIASLATHFASGIIKSSNRAQF